MKKLWLCLFAFLFAINPMLSPRHANAQSIAQPQVRQTDEALTAYLESEFRKTHIPGMGVQIVDADGIQYSGAFGDCTSLDSGFIIGSLSKSFTAVCILQLVEQGRIELSDPVARYLPEEDQGRGTTIQQLLNQTSGIRTYDTVEDHTTADTPVAFEYANVNYALLGKIIERVTGMTYAQYIQAHIFGPLGMAHTFTSLERAKESGMAPGYRNYFGMMVEGEVPYPKPDGAITGWLTMPAGYIISSTNDMGRYLQMLLRGGENILTNKSVEAMMSAGVAVTDGYSYGMGLGLDTGSGEPMVIHGGNVENYTTYMILMPERGIAAIVLCNACDFFVANDMVIGLAENFVNAYLGQETQDIEAGAYTSAHALTDGICVAALLLCALPLITLKRWCARKSDGHKRRRMISLVLMHGIAPALLLSLFPLLGEPLFVVRGFAPDVFLVLVVGSLILVLTGIAKIAIMMTRR